MAKDFKWLTGDPESPTDVKAELACLIRLEALLDNINAPDVTSEENKSKRFRDIYPLGEGNGRLLVYQDGSLGYSPPGEESWEDENLMSVGPLYPGFVYVSGVRSIIGEKACAEIEQEREVKYALYYKRMNLSGQAEDATSAAFSALAGAFKPDPNRDVAAEQAALEVLRDAELERQRIEQMSDDEILAAPDPS